ISIYKEIEPLSREEALKNLTSEDPLVVSRAMLSIVLHDDDSEWVYKFILEQLDLEDPEFLSTAVLCLNHYDRIHGGVDKGTIIPKLKLLAKKYPAISGRVEFTIDDLEV
ncbi:MAG: hypothetical protein GY765_26770, partial [bacterium]|nr:hypothetical protein [bacterium]